MNANVMKTILACAAAVAVVGCRYRPTGGAETPRPSRGGRAAMPGSPCGAAPAKAEWLDESGELALFAGETAADAAANRSALAADREMPMLRNSLFLRRRKADGKSEWRLLLTTGSGWRIADGMNEWCSLHARSLKKCFVVRRARFSSDGRHLWLVCDSYSYTFTVVCSYDMAKETLCVLTDGDTADEQPDGTILVKNKKTYLQDEKGNPLGAAWYDEWILPDGKVVRKTEPSQSGRDL